MIEEQLPIADIMADSDFNCRGKITPATVSGLMSDIQRDGLLSPILVRPLQHPTYKYKIIAGHRRFLACQLLKEETIRAFIHTELTDKDARRINLIENISRQNLNMMQEARALTCYVEEGTATNAIAKELGVSTFWVEVRLRLLDLEPELQVQAAAGLLTNQHILDLHRMTKPRRMEAANIIKEARLRGERLGDIIVKKRHRSPLARTRKTSFEVQEMVEHILSVYGECLATRLGAWANGSISDIDFFRDLRQLCQSEGKPYQLPDDFKKYAFYLDKQP